MNLWTIRLADWVHPHLHQLANDVVFCYIICLNCTVDGDGETCNGQENEVGPHNTTLTPSDMG
jgi:hypothetical protein